MKNILKLYGLFYQRFSVRKSTVGGVSDDRVGSNLLAAGQVWVTKTQQTIRQWIGAPLEGTYPLYKKLNGRFSKGGYQLVGFSHSDTQSPEISIEKNKIDSSSQVLIGNCNGYKSHVSRSIRLMRGRSIGRPPVSFLLSGVNESMTGKSKMLLTQGKLSEKLMYPVRLSDFVRDDEVNKFTKIIVRCVMAILFHLKNRKNAQLSCLDRFNRFPSFYQSVRLASFRLQKSRAIYNRYNKYAHELFGDVRSRISLFGVFSEMFAAAEFYGCDGNGRMGLTGTRVKKMKRM
jgi:hypothetical protein